MLISWRFGRQQWIEIDEREVAEYQMQGATCVEVAGKEAKDIITRWEKGAPFLRGLFDLCVSRAEDRGYILTLLKRRCRFQLDGKGQFSWTHKAMNRLCQSSAADQLKMGLRSLWRAKLIPLLPIHDEVVFSLDINDDAKRIVPHLENAAKLLVPSVVEVKFGKNWGEIPK